MTTITNELGTFTGADEKEALKKARAAKRREARLEKRRVAARAIAADRARSNAFRVHDMLAEVRTGEREALPRAWNIYAPGEVGVSCKPRPSGAPGDVLGCWSPHGSAAVDFVGQRVEAVLVNGAGEFLLVFLQESAAIYAEPRGSCVAVGIADVAGSDESVVALASVCLTLEEVRDRLDDMDRGAIARQYLKAQRASEAE